MRRAFLAATTVTAAITAASSTAFGQVSKATSAAAPDGGRDAAIKSALARERGDITAMEASSGDAGGVFIGYSSGTVLNCRGEKACRKFAGIPAGPVSGEVREIAVSRRGDQEIVWIAYPHGVLYRCVDYDCGQIRWAAEEAE